MTSMPLSEEAVQAHLKRVRAAMDRAADDPVDRAHREAASVLVWFSPRALRAAPPHDAVGWDNFAQYCEPVLRPDRGDWWRLRTEFRRPALQRLGTRERMRAALAANPERPDEPTQRVFEDIIRGATIDIERMPRDELAGLATVLSWVDGILTELPSHDALSRALPMADLLAPMRRLANRSFVGRQAELKKLREYVGIETSKSKGGWPWRFVKNLVPDLTKTPPLLIFGPGGVGKSTLVAQFILEHTQGAGADALPFVYLDMDRPVLDVENPVSLLFEAARQLATELPAQRDQLERFIENFEQEARRFDSFEQAKSVGNLMQIAAHRFGELLSALSSPVLVVVDTFEEAQFLGEEVVHGFWQLFVEVQKAAPHVRTVVAGRAKVTEFPTRGIELGDLSATDAMSLLRKFLEGSDGQDEKALKQIVDIVGRNPMSLRLAAEVVRDAGVGALRTVDTRNRLMLRVRDETLQARLYGRILAHIHDPDVGKLAYPGLVVRRITPAVVREVLAKPCGLDVSAPGAAEDLVERLASEIALVERDADGALCHRQDVRRLMLNDLTNAVPATVVREIHDGAVRFYQDQDGATARTEEIYHRLARGDDPSTVEHRWQAGVELRLRGALEELPTRSRLWLSPKLGVTPPRDLLKKADIEQWEEITGQKAQRLLQTGDANEALRVLRERKDRSPASPIHALEIEALRTLGRLTEASEVVQRALDAADLSDRATTRDLLIQAALIEESQDNLQGALARIREAHGTLPQPSSASDPQQAEQALRVLVPETRLLRKLGDWHDAERRSLIEQATALLTAEMLSNLRNRPALLRELAAELGGVVPNVLQHAIETLGVEIRSDEHEESLAHALRDWNTRLLVIDRPGPGELAERAGLRENTPTGWRQYLKSIGGYRLGRNVLGWRSALSADRQMDKAIVNAYRDGVEAGLQRRQVAL
jgi:hypothetical protein